MNKIADQWSSYQLLYAGDCWRIENWQGIILKRPDPMALWPLPKQNTKIAAVYHRSKSGGGTWEYLKPLPESWQLSYGSLTFKVAPLGFKHTGLFPEQAANWDSISAMIKKVTYPVKLLNLFAYTGGASLAAALAGAEEVVHVDASRGMVKWAQENQKLSNLNNHKIRFIVDDCLKFIAKEQRRNNKYQAIILDPPSFGRGPNKEIWQFEQQINLLIKESARLLADDALFFLLNGYTAGYSSEVLKNLLCSSDLIKRHFKTVLAGELLLPVVKQDIYLPSGSYGIAYND